jgi:hypothetical protein
MVAVTNGPLAAFALMLVAATSHFSPAHSFSAISSRAAARNDVRTRPASSVDAALAPPHSPRRRTEMGRRRRRRLRSGGASSPATELRGSSNDPDDPAPSSSSSLLLLGDSDATVLGAAGAIASTVMIYSESVLFRTGCGLPAGPFGLVGAAEGVSYLGVVGLVGFSLYTKIRTVSDVLYSIVLALSCEVVGRRLVNTSTFAFIYA